MVENKIPNLDNINQNLNNNFFDIIEELGMSTKFYAYKKYLYEQKLRIDTGGKELTDNDAKIIWLHLHQEKMLKKLRKNKLNNIITKI